MVSFALKWVENFFESDFDEQLKADGLWTPLAEATFWGPWIPSEEPTCCEAWTALAELTCWDKWTALEVETCSDLLIMSPDTTKEDTIL